MACPGGCNRFAAKTTYLAIEDDISAEACYGEYAGELHYPPYQHLNAEQCESYPRTDYRRYEYRERHVCIEHVGARDVLVVLPHCQPLPYRAQEQDGREDEVDEFVGNQYNTEGDDYKTDCHKRTVYPVGALDLTVVEAQQ